MELAVFLGSLLVILTTGIPIAFVILICCLILMIFMGNVSAFTAAQQLINGTNSASLMAIPFFMLAGELMAKGGLSKRIVDFANIVVGRVHGGLGYAAIIASIIFSGLSGSPVADASALGAILVPMMVANKYDRATSTALICAGAIIAPLIPPSVPMIVLGSAVSGLSITKMFMGGLVPGLVVGIVLMIAWRVVVKRNGYKDTVRYSREETLKILKESLPALFLPVIIIGGIRFGIFTTTEAGAFACVYALAVSMFVYKEIRVPDVVPVAVATARSTAVVMFVVCTATVAGNLITLARIPQQMATLLAPMVDKPVLLLTVIMLFLFFMGMIMDLTPNLLIFGPVLFPVAVAAGIDPTYFGIMMVFNLCLGLITPPVGTILYLGCSVGGTTFGDLVKAIMPFLICELVILFAFVLFPDLILVPLNLLM